MRCSERNPGRVLGEDEAAQALAQYAEWMGNRLPSEIYAAEARECPGLAAFAEQTMTEQLRRREGFAEHRRVMAQARKRAGHLWA